jgi:hypothetical protein
VVDRLRATVPALVALVTGSPAAVLDQRPAPDEWNAATVVAHLADAELVYGVRLRMVLTQPGAMLPAYNERDWAARFGPLDQDVHRSLARFRALRESTMAILESLADNEWARVGVHEERGSLSVADIADLMAAHDSAHLDQIRTALAG